MFYSYERGRNIYHRLGRAEEGDYITINRSSPEEDLMSVRSREDLWSVPARKPADIVHEDLLPYYNMLGRGRLISVLKDHPTASLQEVIKHLKRLTK